MSTCKTNVKSYFPARPYVSAVSSCKMEIVLVTHRFVELEWGDAIKALRWVPDMGSVMGTFFSVFSFKYTVILCR